MQCQKRIFIYTALLSVLSVSSNSLASSVSDSARVFGGQAVSAQDPIAASTVSVHAEFGRICTGTLISNTAVLTAGHCIISPTLSVRFGINGDETSAPTIAVSRSIVHPLFNMGPTPRNFYDVAVLILEQPAPAGYTPAALLKDPNVVQNKVVLTVAGFGRSNPNLPSDGSLNKANLSVVDSQFTPVEFLLSQTAGAGSCFGDSGGPAYATVNGVLYVAGVVNRGPSPLCNAFGVYAKVAVHNAWINTVIGN
jgi:secreted trypsin-like serine protease